MYDCAFKKIIITETSGLLSMLAVYENENNPKSPGSWQMHLTFVQLPYPMKTTARTGSVFPGTTGIGGRHARLLLPWPMQGLPHSEADKDKRSPDPKIGAPEFRLV